MNSKELILESIRKHTQTKYEKPELSVDAITYPDKQAKFCEMLQFVGGEFLILKEGENLKEMITSDLAQNGCPVYTGNFNAQ